MPQPVGTGTLVICGGVYGSASTWLFNAAKLVLKSTYPLEKLYSTYSDTGPDSMSNLMGDARFVVLKTHAPSESLRKLALSDCKVLLTVRDPADCVASIMQRFWLPFEQAVELVEQSTTTLVALANSVEHALLRYETGFSQDHRGMRTVAGFLLGRQCSEEMADALAPVLWPEAVKQTIDGLIADRVFDGTAPSAQFDPETHWHPRHVGTIVSNQGARILTSAQLSTVATATKEFRTHFGY